MTPELALVGVLVLWFVFIIALALYGRTFSRRARRYRGRHRG